MEIAGEIKWWEWYSVLLKPETTKLIKSASDTKDILIPLSAQKPSPHSNFNLPYFPFPVLKRNSTTDFSKLNSNSKNPQILRPDDDLNSHSTRPEVVQQTKTKPDCPVGPLPEWADKRSTSGKCNDSG